MNEPEWIVNDLAELGVLMDGKAYFLYKGHSRRYESGLRDDGTPMMYRPVQKREFGTVCRPTWHVDFGDAPVYPGAEDGLRYEEGEGWLPLPVEEGAVMGETMTLRPPLKHRLSPLRRQNRHNRRDRNEINQLPGGFHGPRLHKKSPE